MDRRSAMKQAALLAGGLAWLPSCDFSPKRAAVALDNLELDVNYQDLLAKVAATIIPSSENESGDKSPSKTSSIGAEELDLYRFILVMVDDCVEKKDQVAFSNGLQQLVPFTERYFEKPFPQEEQSANEAILIQLMEMKGVPALEDRSEPALKEATQSPEAILKDIQGFLGMTKRYTIQGYMISEYFMTEKFPYKLVPGSYQGCVSTEGLTVM